MLDNTDREIIAYLQYDGRTPYTQIAEELNNLKLRPPKIREKFNYQSTSTLMR